MSDLRKIRSKALTYIRTARARVVKAVPHEWEQRDLAAAVAGRVRGHRDIYWPLGKDQKWRCTCPDSVDGDGNAVVMDQPLTQCAHVAAVALMVGWPSAAAPLAPEPTPEENS